MLMSFTESELFGNYCDLPTDDEISDLMDTLSKSPEHELSHSHASSADEEHDDVYVLEQQHNEPMDTFEMFPAEAMKRTTDPESKNRPYECTFVKPGEHDACARRFTKLAHLKAHYMTHTGERPFKCTEAGCNKSFTQLSTLKNHLLTHSGDKQHPCPHPGCSKRFSRPSTLRNHLNTHITERRTFVCVFDGCSKQFTQVSSLRTHLRTHTGEKPFVCPIDGCGRTFNRQSNRKRHLATHAPRNKRVRSSNEAVEAVPQQELAMPRLVSVPVNSTDDIFFGLHGPPMYIKTEVKTPAAGRAHKSHRATQRV